jgi:hypothetical protein
MTLVVALKIRISGDGADDIDEGARRRRTWNIDDE